MQKNKKKSRKKTVKPRLTLKVVKKKVEKNLPFWMRRRKICVNHERPRAEERIVAGNGRKAQRETWADSAGD